VTLDIRVASGDGSLFEATDRVLAANARVELGMIAASRTFRLVEIYWSGDVTGRNHYLGGPRPFDLDRTADAYRTLLGADVVANATIAS
jgi:hypothetical protein